MKGIIGVVAVLALAASITSANEYGVKVTVSKSFEYQTQMVAQKATLPKGAVANAETQAILDSCLTKISQASTALGGAPTGDELRSLKRSVLYCIVVRQKQGASLIQGTSDTLKVLIAAGAPVIQIATLRRTTASNLVGSGEPFGVIMDLPLRNQIVTALRQEFPAKAPVATAKNGSNGLLLQAVLDIDAGKKLSADVKKEIEDKLKETKKTKP